MKNLTLLFTLLTFSLGLQAQCLKGDCNNHYSTLKIPREGTYRGHFLQGQPHGTGQMIYLSGKVYKGQWAYGEYHGEGILELSSGTYEGQFKRGKFDGYGEFKFPNGDVYVGAWKNNKQHGQGRIYKKEGSRFEGQFDRGKMHGPGKIIKLDGTVITGNWVNGKKQSHQMLAELDNIDRDCNRSYCKRGKGTYTYNNGNIYKGNFVDGRPKGLGTLTYYNGDVHSGEFDNHLPNGSGILKYANGGQVKGIFNEGKLIEEEFISESLPQDKETIINKDDVNIYALIIGISEYPTVSQELMYADDDARRLYHHLRSPQGGALRNDQLKLLVNGRANKENILKEAANIFSKADENDLVLFYYSGHGTVDGFVPFDNAMGSNVVRHESLAEIFNQSKAKHKIIIADACHAGALGFFNIKGSDRIQEELSPALYQKLYNAKSGYAFLLSSKLKEESFEHDKLRAGIFSHYLIRGLKGEANANGDSTISISELFRYTQAEVKGYTKGKQTPILFGMFDPATPISESLRIKRSQP